MAYGNFDEAHSPVLATVAMDEMDQEIYRSMCEADTELLLAYLGISDIEGLNPLSAVNELTKLGEHYNDFLTIPEAERMWRPYSAGNISELDDSVHIPMAINAAPDKFRIHEEALLLHMDNEVGYVVVSDSPEIRKRVLSAVMTGVGCQFGIKTEWQGGLVDGMWFKDQDEMEDSPIGINVMEFGAADNVVAEKWMHFLNSEIEARGLGVWNPERSVHHVIAIDNAARFVGEDTSGLVDLVSRQSGIKTEQPEARLGFHIVATMSSQDYIELMRIGHPLATNLVPAYGWMNGGNAKEIARMYDDDQQSLVRDEIFNLMSQQLVVRQADGSFEKYWALQ